MTLRGSRESGLGSAPLTPAFAARADAGTQAPARDLALEKAIEVLAGELKKAA